LRFATGSSHIWWGVSVEDKKHGLPRIDNLRNTPATIKFLSVEPLLESLGEVSLVGIDWVIVGGESGWGARKLEEEWVQELLAKCQRQDVRFFFKQWGGTRKKLNGRLLNGRTYDELPILQ
jgi:protein gp37